MKTEDKNKKWTHKPNRPLLFNQKVCTLDSLFRALTLILYITIHQKSYLILFFNNLLLKVTFLISIKKTCNLSKEKLIGNFFWTFELNIWYLGEDQVRGVVVRVKGATLDH